MEDRRDKVVSFDEHRDRHSWARANEMPLPDADHLISMADKSNRQPKSKNILKKRLKRILKRYDNYRELKMLSKEEDAQEDGVKQKKNR